MAGQGVFLRISNLVHNSRFLLTNRTLQINLHQPHAGLKQEVVQKLKDANTPEKPKRPLSSYFRFLRRRRDELHREEPNLKMIELTKKCAAEWRTLDSEQKEKLDEEVKKEMEVYAKETLKYNAKLTDEQRAALEAYRQATKNDKKKRKERKVLKEENKPRKPVGAYMLFVMEQAKHHDAVKVPELMRQLKFQWAELPAEQKQKYENTSKQARQDYEIQLLDWEMKMIKKGNESLVRKSTLLEKRPATARGLNKVKPE